MVPVPFEVTFDTMSTSGSLACINISIPQDFALEGDHEFSIQLSTLSPDIVTIGSPPHAEVDIADDESKWVYVLCIYGLCIYLHNYVFVLVCVYIVYKYVEDVIEHYGSVITQENLANNLLIAFITTYHSSSNVFMTNKTPGGAKRHRERTKPESHQTSKKLSLFFFFYSGLFIQNYMNFS